jgi:hypothetical protein
LALGSDLRGCSMAAATRQASSLVDAPACDFREHPLEVFPGVG